MRTGQPIKGHLLENEEFRGALGNGEKRRRYDLSWSGVV
jgi:hypothetical protein